MTFLATHLSLFVCLRNHEELMSALETPARFAGPSSSEPELEQLMFRGTLGSRWRLRDSFLSLAEESEVDKFLTKPSLVEPTEVPSTLTLRVATGSLQAKRSRSSSRSESKVELPLHAGMTLRYFARRVLEMEASDASFPVSAEAVRVL